MLTKHSSLEYMKKQLHEDGRLLFSLLVIPQSKVQELSTIEQKEHRGHLSWEMQLRIKSPPQDGKANKEIVLYIAELFHISKTCVSIRSGSTGRTKIIALTL